MSANNSTETDSSLSDLFEMLSHEHRRRILMAVARANPQDEDDLTDEAVPNDDEADADAMKLFTQHLHHTHLPKLEQADFIEWDREQRIITRGPRFDEIEPLLELMQDHQDELPDDWP